MGDKDYQPESVVDEQSQQKTGLLQGPLQKWLLRLVDVLTTSTVAGHPVTCPPTSLFFVLLSHSAMVGKFLSSYVFLSFVEFPCVNSIRTPRTTSWLD